MKSNVFNPSAVLAAARATVGEKSERKIARRTAVDRWKQNPEAIVRSWPQSRQVQEYPERWDRLS